MFHQPFAALNKLLLQTRQRKVSEVRIPSMTSTQFIASRSDWEWEVAFPSAGSPFGLDSGVGRAFFIPNPVCTGPQVSLPTHHHAVPALPGSPAAVLFGHRPLTAVLVGFMVMFLLSLAAFLLYIFTLPPDRGGGN